MMLNSGQRGILDPQLFDVILASLDVAITLYDDQERLIWWNASAANIFPKARHILVAGTNLDEMLLSIAEAGYAVLSRGPLDSASAIDAEELILADGRRLNRQRVPLPNGTTLITHTDASCRLDTELPSQAQREHERNALIIEGATDGSFEADLVRGTSWYSAQAHEMLGFPDGTLNGPRKLVLDLVHPIDAQESLAQLDAASAARARVVTYTRRIRHAGGAWRWVKTRGILIYSEAGVPIRLVGSWTDVTSNKQAESHLIDSESRYKLVLEASHEGVFDRDLVANTVWFSSSTHASLGLPDTSLNGDPEIIRRRMHPQDLAAFVESQREAYRRNDPTFEGSCRTLHVDGSWRWILTRARIIYADNGKPVRYLGSLNDITAQKTAEHELELKQIEIRRAAAWRDAVLQSLPGMVAILDEQGVISEVNREWRQFAAKNGASMALEQGKGVDYIAACESVASPFQGRSLAECLRMILDGSMAELDLSTTPVTRRATSSGSR